MKRKTLKNLMLGPEDLHEFYTRKLVPVGPLLRVSIPRELIPEHVDLKPYQRILLGLDEHGIVWIILGPRGPENPPPQRIEGAAVWWTTRMVIDCNGSLYVSLPRWLQEAVGLRGGDVIDWHKWDDDMIRGIPGRPVVTPLERRQVILG